jgi:hypothetical protein
LGWYLGNTLTNKTLQKMETDSVVSGAEQSDLNNLNVILDKNPEQCRKSSQVLNH